MKVKVVGLIALFVMSGLSLSAKEQNKKFKVSGNCSMCEKRIEKAAKSVEGVSLADWDKKSKLISVTFDDQKTDVDKVQQAIAKVGHDTPKHKASDEVYNELPGCCQYDRSEKSDEKHDHQHNH